MKIGIEAKSSVDWAEIDQAAREAIEKAMAEGAAIIVEDARALVAPLRISGELEQSIGGEASGMRITVWARKWYAPIVEFGRKGYAAGDSRAAGRSSGGKVRWRNVARAVHATRAKPFMRPAIYGAMSRISALIAAAVARATNRQVTIDVQPNVKAPLSHTVSARKPRR